MGRMASGRPGSSAHSMRFSCRNRFSAPDFLTPSASAARAQNRRVEITTVPRADATAGEPEQAEKSDE